MTVQEVKWDTERWTPWAQPACPMLLCLTLTPSFEPLRALVGAPLFTSIIEFQGEVGTWLYRDWEAEALGRRLLDILRIPKHLSGFEQGLENSVTQLREAITAIPPLDELNSLGSQQLLEMFHTLEDSFTSFYRFGAFVEPIQTAAQTYLQPTLERVANEVGKELDITTSSLYRLDEHSSAVGELIDLSHLLDELAFTLGQDPNTQNVMSLPLQRALTELESQPQGESVDVLNHYLRLHSWVKNNYLQCEPLTLGQLFDDDIAHLGETLLDAQKEAHRELAEIQTTHHQDQTLKKYLLTRLTPAEAQVLSIHDAIGGRLLESRKTLVKRVNARFVEILRALASTIGWDVADMLRLIPEELNAAVASPDRYEPRVAARKVSCLVYRADFSVLDEETYDWDTGFQTMDGPTIVEGDSVAPLLIELDDRLDLHPGGGHDADHLEGTVVYRDPNSQESRGTARVIRNPKGATLARGEILVTSSTTPEFLPLMRKAAAIVTDWGGQTSHAAIISRELKIPCIIDTKTGSYVIQSGKDIVIDWKNGTVRVIKEAGG